MQCAAVDDSTAFQRMVRGVYPNIDSFRADFREFQKETGTSFYVYSSETSEMAKKRGAPMPEGVPYYFVKYCCVHRRRKGGKSSRYPNFDCKAHVTIRFAGSCYCVVSWYMKHSHSFQIENEGLYVGNRRLTHEQEAHVFQVMDSFGNTSELRDYVFKKFNRRLTRGDFRSIKVRLSKNEPSSELVQDQGLLNTYGCSEVIPDNRAIDAVQLQKQQRQSPITVKGDRLSECEQVLKDIREALSKLEDKDFDYINNQLSLLPAVLSVHPDVQILYRLSDIQTPVAIKTHADIHKISAHRKQSGTSNEGTHPSTSMESEIRTNCSRDVRSSRRKLVLNPRIVDDGGASSYLGQLHTVAPRIFRPATSAAYQPTAKRRRLDIASSLTGDDVVRKQDPSADLDKVFHCHPQGSK